MRTPLVAGNWKMNKTVAEARDLVSTMSMPLGEIAGVEKVLCPPYMALMAVSYMLENSSIGVGAQNMHWEAKGAFTGELAANMIKEFCNYVIIGHSERRTYFGETDETVNKKTVAALNATLIPIVCVGETLDQYEAGQTAEVVHRQIKAGLAGIAAADAAKVVVAYEPVWAIGTGKTATSQQAQDMHVVIRKHLSGKYGQAVANEISILYGGSVNAANAKELFSCPDVDGGLVGGASLKSREFTEIIKSA